MVEKEKRLIALRPNSKERNGKSLRVKRV